MNIILANAKAITAFITGIIFIGLQPIGVTPDTTTGDALELVVNALLVGISVWAIPNRKV